MRHDPRYVAARRVLLDALDALTAHTAALVVAGAQAVYLRTRDERLGVAPFTLDADLALDPALLDAEPLLEDAMTGGRFELFRIKGHVEPGIWLSSERIAGVGTSIPVDLLVPDAAAPRGGRRGARLGVHGRRAARRIVGLEAALIDHSPMRIEALDPADGRARTVKVAGPAALLVAKAHKLAERLRSGRDHRVDGKDALDVLRLMLATQPSAVARRLAELGDDPIAGLSVATGRQHLSALFGRRGRPGVELAAQASRLNMTTEQVEAVCVAYMDALRGGD